MSEFRHLASGNLMRIPKLKWVIAGMLFLATTVNYADRLALSIISPDIRKEFSMTEEDYSYIVSGFLAAYAIMYAGSWIPQKFIASTSSFPSNSSARQWWNWYALTN